MWTSLHNPQGSLIQKQFTEVAPGTGSSLRRTPGFGWGLRSFEPASSVPGYGGFSFKRPSCHQPCLCLAIEWASHLSHSCLHVEHGTKHFESQDTPQPLLAQMAKVRGPGLEGDVREQATWHPATSPFPGTLLLLLFPESHRIQRCKLRLSLIFCLEGDGDVWMNLVLNY